jgi:hypothetical protein
MSDLSELKELLTDFKDELIEIRRNTVVIAARLDAIEPEVGNLAIVMSTVANQCLDLHDKLIKESDRVARHFKRLEIVGSNGNGAHHEAEEDDR